MRNLWLTALVLATCSSPARESDMLANTAPDEPVPSYWCVQARTTDEVMLGCSATHVTCDLMRRTLLVHGGEVGVREVGKRCVESEVR